MVDCIKHRRQIQQSQYSNPLLFHIGSYVIGNLKLVFDCKMRMPGTVKCRPTVAY